MSASAYVKQLEHLKLNECAALGHLKGSVAGILITQESGLTPSLRQWSNLRLAYDIAERSASAVMDHIMLPIGQD